MGRMVDLLFVSRERRVQTWKWMELYMFRPSKTMARGRGGERRYPEVTARAGVGRFSHDEDDHCAVASCMVIVTGTRVKKIGLGLIDRHRDG